jgi:DNA-directed RNA polymerase subunit L
LYVSTEDFKIKNIETGKYLNEKETRDIFPPNDQTGYYIDFVRLRPRISDEIPGEKIHLTCAFSVKTVKDNSMYNSVCTCSYGYTPDYVKIEDVLNQKKQEWKDNGLSGEEIDFETKNWKLLDALRITKEDSFDFVIQTVGVFENTDIVRKGCDILINKLNLFKDVIETDTIIIAESKTTMTNCYDIVLKNEDYTLGKAIEFVLYNKYFDTTEENAILTYCGFKKMHPHDTDSLIRLAFKTETEVAMIKSYLLICIQEALNVFTSIKAGF